MTEIVKVPSDEPDKPTAQPKKPSGPQVRSSIRDRVARAQQKAAAPERPLEELPNRIGLLLDVSGSMNSDYLGKSCDSWLRDAAEVFVRTMDSDDTAVGLCLFGTDDSGGVTRKPMVSNKTLLNMEIQGLHASGSTPMGEALESALTGYPLTRVILVSDGHPDSKNFFGSGAEGDNGVLDGYIEMKIPIDCVHIGSSTGGEDVLKRIAQLTGGMYFKFTDVKSFAEQFKFLAPAYRAQVASGEIKLLGCAEAQGVKK